MNGWTDRYQQTDRQGRQVDGWIDIDRQIQICKHTYICEWVDGYINGYTHPIIQSFTSRGWMETESVVDRLIPTHPRRDGPILIPKTCAYVTFHGQRDFVDVIVMNMCSTSLVQALGTEGYKRDTPSLVALPTSPRTLTEIWRFQACHCHLDVMQYVVCYVGVKPHTSAPGQWSG